MTPEEKLEQARVLYEKLRDFVWDPEGELSTSDWRKARADVRRDLEKTLGVTPKVDRRMRPTPKPPKRSRPGRPPKEEAPAAIPVVVEERPVMRVGPTWYSAKLSIADKFVGSRFDGVYKDVDDFAKFATDIELSELQCQTKADQSSGSQ